MGYEILYNKQFIKVDDKRVIPFIQSGSNNCYEWSGTGNRQRRARDWYNTVGYNPEGKIIANADDILADIIKERDATLVSYPEDTAETINKSYGSYKAISVGGRSQRSTSFGSYLGFFKQGIAQAKTIEELAEKGIEIYITTSRYSKDELAEKGLEEKPSVTFTTTEQLVSVIDEYEAYYKGTGVCYYISTHSPYSIESMQKAERRAKKAALPAKRLLEIDNYYVLKCLQVSGYFIKQSKRAYRYAFNPNNGKKFMTEKEANAYHKTMKRRELFAVEKINGRTTILA